MKQGKYRALFDLTGKVAIVTGGCGILGRYFCAGLADFGASVAVVDLDLSSAEDMASNLIAEFGVKSIGVACDVTDESSVENMVLKVEDSLGSIDILHNNAATKGHDTAKFFNCVEDYSLETWREVMAVNLDGMFNVAKIVGKGMVKGSSGS